MSCNRHIDVSTIGKYELGYDFLIWRSLLCTLSCGYNRYTQLRAIYVKSTFLPFLSAALIIVVAKLR